MPSPKITKRFIKAQLHGVSMKRTKSELIDGIQDWVQWGHIDPSRGDRAITRISTILWCAGISDRDCIAVAEEIFQEAK